MQHHTSQSVWCQLLCPKTAQQNIDKNGVISVNYEQINALWDSTSLKAETQLTYVMVE